MYCQLRKVLRILKRQKSIFIFSVKLLERYFTKNFRKILIEIFWIFSMCSCFLLKKNTLDFSPSRHPIFSLFPLPHSFYVNQLTPRFFSFFSSLKTVKHMNFYRIRTVEASTSFHSSQDSAHFLSRLSSRLCRVLGKFSVSFFLFPSLWTISDSFFSYPLTKSHIHSSRPTQVLKLAVDVAVYAHYFPTGPWFFCSLTSFLSYLWRPYQVLYLFVDGNPLRSWRCLEQTIFKVWFFSFFWNLHFFRSNGQESYFLFKNSGH